MEENDGIECDEKEEDDIVEGDRSVKMISIHDTYDGDDLNFEQRWFHIDDSRIRVL